MFDSCFYYRMHDKYYNTSKFYLPTSARNFIVYEFKYNKNVNSACVIA